MNDRQIYLTEEELIVCAGFLSTGFFYGIRESFFRGWEQNDSERIRRIVKCLEEKQFIGFFPGGVLEMNPLLYELITCMTEAEEILILEEKIKRKEPRRIYCYKKKNRICTMETGFRNQISFVTAEEVRNLMEKKHFSISEVLDSALCCKIDALEKEMEREDADKLLKKYLQEKSQSSLIRQVIKKRQDEGILSYYKWENKILKEESHVTYGITEKGCFEILRTKDEKVLFQGKMERYDQILQQFLGG